MVSPSYSTPTELRGAPSQTQHDLDSDARSRAQAVRSDGSTRSARASTWSTCTSNRVLHGVEPPMGSPFQRSRAPKRREARLCARCTIRRQGAAHAVQCHPPVASRRVQRPLRSRRTAREHEADGASARQTSTYRCSSRRIPRFSERFDVITTPSTRQQRAGRRLRASGTIAAVMKRRTSRRQDPVERAIEAALAPGQFVGYRSSRSLRSDSQAERGARGGAAGRSSASMSA